VRKILLALAFIAIGCGKVAPQPAAQARSEHTRPSTASPGKSTASPAKAEAAHGSSDALPQRTFRPPLRDPQSPLRDFQRPAMPQPATAQERARNDRFLPPRPEPDPLESHVPLLRLAYAGDDTQTIEVRPSGEISMRAEFMMDVGFACESKVPSNRFIFRSASAN